MGARCDRGQAIIEILGVMVLLALLIVGLESFLPNSQRESKTPYVFKLQKKETLK